MLAHKLARLLFSSAASLLLPGCPLVVLGARCSVLGAVGLREARCSCRRRSGPRGPRHVARQPQHGRQLWFYIPRVLEGVAHVCAEQPWLWHLATARWWRHGKRAGGLLVALGPLGPPPCRCRGLFARAESVATGVWEQGFCLLADCLVSRAKDEAVLTAKRGEGRGRGTRGGVFVVGCLAGCPSRQGGAADCRGGAPAGAACAGLE